MREFLSRASNTFQLQAESGTLPGNFEGLWEKAKRLYAELEGS